MTMPLRPHRWYRRDRGLTARMAVAILLVVVSDAGALMLVSLFPVPLWIIVFTGVAFLGVQLLFAPYLALAAARGRRVEEYEAPRLHALVGRLCQLANLPKPAIAIAERDAPIAFTVGRSPRNATLCVSSGLLERLNPRERVAVIAHELAHIENRDAVVMSVAAVVPMLAGLGLRMAFWDAREDESGLLAIPSVVMIPVRFALVVPMAVAAAVWALTLPAVAALSRHRELAADRGAALITGDPWSLAAALLRLSGDLDRIPRRDLRTVALSNALLVMPAPPWHPGLGRLIATHPPVERRVERLLALEAIAARPTA
jgi:heat shock protein HtpX